jgi:choline-glycine betaine transporter
MTSFGSLEPGRLVKFVWGALMAAIASVLLYAGGLEALQIASLVAALPFTILLMMLMFAVIKFVRKEPLPIRKADLNRFRRLEKAANEWKKKK